MILRKLFDFLGKKQVTVKTAEEVEKPVAPYKIEASVPTPEPVAVQLQEIPKTEEVVVPASVAKVKKSIAKPATATKRKTKTTKG